MTEFVTERPILAPVLSHRPWWRGKPVQVALVAAGMWVAYRSLRLEYPWPSSLAWNSLQFKLDEFQVWLIDQRSAEDKSLIFTIFDGFRIFVDELVAWFTELLLWLTWVGTTVAGTLLVWRFGGLRAAATALVAFAAFALSGLWTESMETLALMIVAVGLSLLVGIPLGIAVGRSRRVERVVRPVLDAAQIVPAFAYLMPVVILFSVGPAAAVVATMVYAIPPGGADHRARDPRGRGQHGGGGDVDGDDDAPDPRRRSSSRWRGGWSCSASTRRSSSRSRWS